MKKISLIKAKVYYTSTDIERQINERPLTNTEINALKDMLVTCTDRVKTIVYFYFCSWHRQFTDGCKVASSLDRSFRYPISMEIKTNVTNWLMQQGFTVKHYDDGETYMAYL